MTEFPLSVRDMKRLTRQFELSRGFALTLLFLPPDAAAEKIVARLRKFGPVLRLDMAVPVPELLGELEGHSEVGFAVLIANGEADHDEDQRENLLARFNERRDMIRARWNRPVLLVLPEGYHPTMITLAPDLWAVREDTFHGQPRESDHDQDQEETGPAVVPVVKAKAHEFSPPEPGTPLPKKHDVEIPPDLEAGFRARTVALLIGPACRTGMPDLGSLLSEMLEDFQERFNLDSQQLGNLKGWLRKKKDYRRACQWFMEKDRGRYLRHLKRAYDPHPNFRNVPSPRLYHLIRYLGIPHILTTNVDLLLEDALGSWWKSMTWQDSGLLEEWRTSIPALVYHLFGTVSRPNTLVLSLTQHLARDKHEKSQQDVARITRDHLIVAIGFDNDEPILKEFANPGGFVRLGSDEDAQIKLPAGPDGIETWFEALLDRLGIVPASMRRVPDMTAEDHWLKITRQWFSSLPPCSGKDAIAYYKGHPPTWALVSQGFTARRRAVDQILEKLRLDKPRDFIAVLVTAAGGEGKSTVLKQVGYELAKRDYKVLEAQSRAANPERALRMERGSLALLIDNAQDLNRIEFLLRKARYRTEPTRLILAARAHEWREIRKNVFVGDTRRMLAFLNLAPLDQTETVALAEILSEMGVPVAPERLQHVIARESNGSLLAAMMQITHGKPLAAIVSDVVAIIDQWPDSERLLDALGIVTAIEEIGFLRSKEYFCGMALFCEVMALSTGSANQLIFQRLVGELDLEESGKRVLTRHPVIAKAVADVLFKGHTPYLEAMAIHTRIVEAAGKLSTEHIFGGGRNFLTIIPHEYKKKQAWQQARELFQTGHRAAPRDAHLLVDWATMEHRLAETTGRDEAEAATGFAEARRLFQRAVEVDPGHAPSWQAWALLEDRVGHVDEARRLFQRAVEADPGDAPAWQAWTILETKLGCFAEARRLLADAEYHCADSSEVRWLRKKSREWPPAQS